MVHLSTAKLKSANIFSVCMYIWQYCTISPNLIVLKTSFGAKPPNLMTTNISAYIVYGNMGWGRRLAGAFVSGIGLTEFTIYLTFSVDPITSERRER